MIRVFITESNNADDVFYGTADVLFRDFCDEDAANEFIASMRELNFTVLVWYMIEEEEEVPKDKED